MRGSGRIFQRKGSSLLWVAYYLRGREHRESARTSDPKQAARFLKHRLREVGADQIGAKPFLGPKQQRITVGQLLDALQADYELRGKCTPQFRAHVAPIRLRFGGWRAVDLTSEAVDSYIEHQLAHGGRKGQGAKPATVNRGTQVLAQAYKLAVSRKHLASAPVIRRLSEAGNARQGFFSELQFAHILENLPAYLRDFCTFGYLTGWRLGEICSLRWADVDGAIIRLLPEHSKNGCGRTVPIVGELADLMERRKAARRVKTPNGVTLAGLVFHHAGQPIVDLRKAWTTATKLAGCPGHLFHDLRRTACRNMVRAGVPEGVAMSISGHRTRSIFDRYAITSEGQKREALERTQQYLALQAQAEAQAEAEEKRVLSLPAPMVVEA